MRTSFSNRGGRRLWLVAGLLALLLAASAAAQQPATPEQFAGYQVRQDYDLGYRFASVQGSDANYATLINLPSGPRLLDASVLAHAGTGSGELFDNLSLTSTGLGGDPESTLRLHLDKGRWYELSGAWRRDTNVFDYNLLSNPLNPATNTPAVGVSATLHELDLSHRMQDYELRLLPFSRVGFRLGYARNVQTGPADTTLHGNVDTQVAQNYRTTMNSFQLGVDFKPLARTVISYDQFLEYFKNDTQATGVPYNYQLSNGAPVDLGFVFTASTPCAAAIANPATTPPTVKPNCNGYLDYSRVAPARTSLPTERLGLQSQYWRPLSVNGSFSYNTGVNSVANYQELANGLTSVTRATNTAAQTQSSRVDVQGDGTAVWTVTSRFRVTDVFHLYRFENPGDYAFNEQIYFAEGPLVSGAGSLLLPPAVFNPANCPAPYTAATCPQHTTASAADLQSGASYTYLGDHTRSDELLLAFDFTPWWGGRAGYRYNQEKVQEGTATFVTGDVYDPGPGAALAFRGNCAKANGALPAACSQNADGSVTFAPTVVPQPPLTSEVADIHGDSMILGTWVRPAPMFRLNADAEFYTADHAFDRIDPRRLEKYALQTELDPSPKVKLTATLNDLESRDNVQYVNQLAHSRSDNLMGTFLPADALNFDLGFTYNDIYSQALECFSLGSSPVAAGVGACPVPASPDGLGALGVYSDRDHYVYAAALVKPAAWATLRLGLAASFTSGSALLLDPLAPSGPLRYDYLRPYGGLDLRATHGVTFSTNWNYFDYGEVGGFPAGLAPISGDNFHANLVTLALHYSF